MAIVLSAGKIGWVLSRLEKITWARTHHKCQAGENYDTHGWRTGRTPSSFAGLQPYEVICSWSGEVGGRLISELKISWSVTIWKCDNCSQSRLQNRQRHFKKIKYSFWESKTHMKDNAGLLLDVLFLSAAVESWGFLLRVLYLCTFLPATFWHKSAAGLGSDSGSWSCWGSVFFFGLSCTFPHPLPMTSFAPYLQSPQLLLHISHLMWQCHFVCARLSDC